MSFFKYPHEFSGGQRQRIAIARCTHAEARALICDESVSALDVSVQAQLLNLLQDLQDEYRDELPLHLARSRRGASYMADEVMVMKRRRGRGDGGPDELYANPKHPYTRLLSIPRCPGRAQ